jgi:glyoxylase-like metal-dependent hydrolase (beta-lactamase superfamily II)
MLKVSRFGEVTRFDLARTILGRGVYWTTAYLVDGLLVDSGCAHSATELGSALADVRLNHIVNTHTHEDHIGANGLLQQNHQGVTILAHPSALPVLADPRGTQPLHTYRGVMWGWPKPSQGEPLEDGAIVDTGRYQFEVIYTPGHSPDHLCLYEPQKRWLFSGDLFVGGKERALRGGYDIWGIIASLKHVSELPVGWLFAGSARVRRDPGPELEAKIEHLETLGKRVHALHQRGRSVSQIVRALCGGPMLLELFTLGNFSRRHLVESYLRMNTE